MLYSIARHVSGIDAEVKESKLRSDHSYKMHC